VKSEKQEGVEDYSNRTTKKKIVCNSAPSQTAETKNREEATCARC